MRSDGFQNTSMSVAGKAGLEHNVLRMWQICNEPQSKLLCHIVTALLPLKDCCYDVMLRSAFGLDPCKDQLT